MILRKHYLEYRENLQMSDFELFNQALNEYEKTTQPEPPILASPQSDEDDSPDLLSSSDDDDGKDVSCSHNNTANEKGIDVCIDCGEEITKKIQHTKERIQGLESDLSEAKEAIKDASIRPITGSNILNIRLLPSLYLLNIHRSRMYVNTKTSSNTNTKAYMGKSSNRQVAEIRLSIR